MWFLKLVAPALSTNIKFLDTAKEIITFTMDVFKNIMKMHGTKLDNLFDQYQPITTDITIQQHDSTIYFIDL
ncbi:unnamed protein product [Spirodela intermedia]|uniref:Uncharacterized protein n=1 Tax=Spirodela intermedia TaxID=51605 RepID=A0A7I8J5P7_SPIIN|nr:unnamed protein product [Spirodela intermedia]CAA6664723.1 unnamed protein product [Spirodela intermedia]